MRSPLLLCLLSLFALPGCETDEVDPGGESPPHRYVSADRDDGRQPDRGVDTGAPGGGEGPEVVEGDIYRLLGDGRLLNLNPYRGLQVVDFHDPAAPQITGQLQVPGEPVEMYVAGRHAVLLLNGWRGYYGARDDVLPEAWEGGLVVVVDVADPERPVERARQRVPGFIRTSRMVEGGGRSALYVVSQTWETVENEEGVAVSESVTTARSFTLGADGTLAPRGEVGLGGDVADVQATPEVLMIARNDWTREGGRSRVALVDIASPDGTMRPGGDVQAAGRVRNKFDMDLYGDVLQVVSSGDGTNHVETFDASDVDRPAPLDHKTFGDGQELFATLFLGEKAFFVTYFRRDPFHAFEVDGEGRITERAEFIVSGWNDFFRATFAGERLIGIGVNDEVGRTMAVSLYDTTDLGNPEPLVARAEVAFAESWSTAQWDDKAFGVVEDAVRVSGPGGALETGLVLLPFTAWDADARRHVSGVQIFTFSKETLTRRGVMDHGTPVRRTFRAADDMPANLSDEALSFFDASDPDRPARLGGLDLAPDHADFFVVGDHGVRLHDTRGAYDWWGAANGEALPPSRLEVVRLADDPDHAVPVASVEVPAGAAVHAVGSTLVVVSARAVEPADPKDPWPVESTVVAWDFADPAHPRHAGELVTRELPAAWNGGWGRPMPADACFDCGWGWNPRHEAIAAGGSLVFVERVPQQRVVGHERVCYTQAVEGPRGCAWDGERACTFYGGAIECRATDGRPEICSGSLERCLYDGETLDCEAVDAAGVETERSCYEWDRYRYWQSVRLHVLDVSAAPRLAATVALPDEQETTAVLGAGEAVYVAFARPTALAGDPRPYVSWHFVRADVRDPDDVRVGAPVNVPGELAAVEDDVVFTRDAFWDGQLARTAICRLRIEGDRATLEGTRRFDGDDVHTLRLDGAGHLLVSHRPSWTSDPVDVGVGTGGGSVAPGGGDAVVAPAEAPPFQSLTVLDATAPDLATLASVAVDTWAELREAVAGRALFAVPGGLLVMNLDDAARPRAQAWFATRGWPQRVLVAGRDLYFAAGRYGVYRFGLDETNLLPRE